MIDIKNNQVIKQAIMAALRRNNFAEFESEKTLSRFLLLTKTLIESNSAVNLTSIVDPDGIATKHICDSLTVSEFLPFGARVLDVGCGGGFPSLPLSVVRDDLKIIGLDSTAKKLTFIESISKALNLTNICTLAARAEEIGAFFPHREAYDAVVARGVARLNFLAELCLPLVKIGGRFVAMKGTDGDIELAEAQNAIIILGGKVEKVQHTSLLTATGELLTRTLIVTTKNHSTSAAYPRVWANIKKHGL